MFSSFQEFFVKGNLSIPLFGVALCLLRVSVSDGWTPALELRFFVLGGVQQEWHSTSLHIHFTCLVMEPCLDPRWHPCDHCGLPICPSLSQVFNAMVKFPFRGLSQICQVSGQGNLCWLLYCRNTFLQFTHSYIFFEMISCLNITRQMMGRYPFDLACGQNSAVSCLSFPGRNSALKNCIVEQRQVQHKVVRRVGFQPYSSYVTCWILEILKAKVMKH